MKSALQNKIRVVFLVLAVCFIFSAKAQVPQKMSYQAVIRDASNALITNTSVGLRISILQGSSTGLAVYIETQTATTNANGLVTLEIGAGTVVRGIFSSIAWGTNTYFIKTETDPKGGTNYTISGTSQFLSVPYALFASDTATNNWGTSGTSIYNNNTGNVGIGTQAPVEKLEIAGKTKTTNLQITSAAGIGKILISDGAGNALWTTPVTSGIVNQQYETSAYNLSTSIQGSLVDFSTTNVTAPQAGTYLITYYLDAYNTFSLSCNNACTTPVVYFTAASIYNKTNDSKYQTQHIDFSLQDHTSSGSVSIVAFSMPEHQISGSLVKTLNANDVIGFKMQSTADVGATGQIRIRESNITLVRLY